MSLQRSQRRVPSPATGLLSLSKRCCHPAMGDCRRWGTVARIRTPSRGAPQTGDRGGASFTKPSMLHSLAAPPSRATLGSATGHARRAAVQCNVHCFAMCRRVPWLALVLALVPSLTDGYTLLSNSGTGCYRQCQIDATSSGRCKTDFCGMGDVGCCRIGVQQAPCDGTVGCDGFQCCSVLHRPPPAPLVPPPPASPPPLVPAPLHFGCVESDLMYLLDRNTI